MLSQQCRAINTAYNRSDPNLTFNFLFNAVKFRRLVTGCYVYRTENSMDGFNRDVRLFFSSNHDDYGYGLSLWDCARFVNILVLLRLLRIIPNIKPMALVTGVTLEIMRSLKSFAGIIIIIYYIFAILGMMLFEQTIDPPPGKTAECHTSLIRISVVPENFFGI